MNRKKAYGRFRKGRKAWQIQNANDPENGIHFKLTPNQAKLAMRYEVYRWGGWLEYQDVLNRNL